MLGLLVATSPDWGIRQEVGPVIHLCQEAKKKFWGAARISVCAEYFRLQTTEEGVARSNTRHKQEKTPAWGALRTHVQP